METLKTIHVTCVLLSFTGFFIRGLWMISDSSNPVTLSLKIIVMGYIAEFVGLALEELMATVGLVSSRVIVKFPYPKVSFFP